MSLSHPIRTRTLSHLLLAGHNPLSPPPQFAASSASPLRQSPSNPSLTPVPLRTWLASIGRDTDVPSTRLSLAGGGGHSLLGYRNEDGVDRVLAVGRNEAGQLGVGFASQEGTRGLVEGFESEEVLQVAAGVQGSYLLVRTGPDSTSLFSFGNLARGRLGHPSLFPPSQPLEPHEEPRQHSLPTAKEVRLPEGVGRIKQIASGFEHLLVLTENGEIFGTGCNTDGQLGLGSSSDDAEGLNDIFALTKLPLPAHIYTHEGGVASISAGADTSALVTVSGKVYSWGNSEYAQALHSHKIDQIPTPLEIDSSFLPSPSRRIVDFRCGGSFSLVLDDRGSVYSAGFGALGLGRETLSTLKMRVVEALEGAGVTRIRAGWGYAAAARDAGTDSALWTWGLNSPHGRLGLGSLPPSPSSSSSAASTRFDPSALPSVARHVYTPTRVDLPLQQLALGVPARAEGGEFGREAKGGEGGEEGERWELGEVEVGEEGMWVEVREEVEVDFD
ncbi:hypothetical protein JCM6882_007509 [Rhodosporidiobolus microsporus]